MREQQQTSCMLGRVLWSDQQRQGREVGMKCMAGRRWRSSETPSVKISHAVDMRGASEECYMVTRVMMGLK